MYRVLRYRYIGPPGNRTSAVVGVPGDPLVYYIGASSGGIWKSADAGEHWEPIFDDQKVQSIGALAIAPSDPNVLWAGTGEAFVRSNISIGNGVYKSTDAGKTWKHMGLDKTGRIGRVVIDARDPDIVFVAAMGHCYGPQKERGVFRTTDGGKTWEKKESGTNKSLRSVSFFGPKTGWAVGGTGTIIHTDDGGKTWIAQQSGTKNDLMCVQFVSRKRGFAGGVFATFLVTDDGGRTWKPSSVFSEEEEEISSVPPSPTCVGGGGHRRGRD